MRYTGQNKHFNRVAPFKPGRSVFNLSHQKLLTLDMGELIPILCHQLYPGDIFKLGINLIARAMPMVAPLLHEINVYVDYWFVSNRNMWPTTKSGSPPAPTDGWEVFITGGEDGTTAPTIPTWNPGSTVVGSLWDYLDFPITVTPNTLPVAFPLRAYNRIWNENYRGEEIVDEINVDTSESILMVAKEKDYFTTAQISQQRGNAVNLPVTLSGSLGLTAASVAAVTGQPEPANIDNVTVRNDTATDDTIYGNSANALANLQGALEGMQIDLSGGTATSIDISAFRLAARTQEFLEINQRVGARYTEAIYGQFGVVVRDDRLDRPEHIGRFKANLNVDSVPQTESSDATTAQGTLVGNGVAVGSKYIAKYHAKEYGVLMAVMFIRPRNVYQQGVDRNWIKQDRLDYYFPVFAHLSEQPITNQEIYAQGAAADDNVFGYIGRWDEMRFMPSKVCGLMRTTFDYWHDSIQFSSLPSLNETFLECDPRKDIFAVPADPGFVVSIGHIIKAIRPLPVIAVPIT